MGFGGRPRRGGGRGWSQGECGAPEPGRGREDPPPEPQGRRACPTLILDLTVTSDSDPLTVTENGLCSLEPVELGSLRAASGCRGETGAPIAISAGLIKGPPLSFPERTMGCLLNPGPWAVAVGASRFRPATERPLLLMGGAPGGAGPPHPVTAGFCQESLQAAPTRGDSLAVGGRDRKRIHCHCSQCQQPSHSAASPCPHSPHRAVSAGVLRSLLHDAGWGGSRPPESTCPHARCGGSHCPDPSSSLTPICWGAGVTGWPCVLGSPPGGRAPRPEFLRAAPSRGLLPWSKVPGWRGGTWGPGGLFLGLSHPFLGVSSGGHSSARGRPFLWEACPAARPGGAEHSPAPRSGLLPVSFSGWSGRDRGPRCPRCGPASSL